jgi:uncharacterized protein (TIGR02118 family)
VPFQLTVLYEPPADPDAFQRYYDDVHIPLATKIPGLQAFTVSRPAATQDGTPARYALIATLTFEDETALGNGMASPEGLATVADLDNFAQAGVTVLAGPASAVI